MAEREQQIEQALRERGIQVSGLKVRESGHLVGLWGEVDSEHDRERAERVVADTMRVDVRNHLAARGGAVLADVPEDAASDEAVAAATEMLAGAMRSRRYIAKHGDTLEKVARQFYGDAGAWDRVRDANRERLGDGDALLAGTELIVP